MKSEALTPKQRLFIAEYVGNGFNATQAALSAGYSKKTAQVMGSENLSKPLIARAIETAIKAKLNNRDRLTSRWLDEVQRVAFSDIREVVDFGADGVTLRASDTLTEDAARAIESVESVVVESEHGSRTTTKAKLHSKTKGLEILGKYLGALGEAEGEKSPAEILDRHQRRERILELKKKLGA